MIHLTSEQSIELLKALLSVLGFFCTKYISRWWDARKARRVDQHYLKATDIDVEINNLLQNIGLTYGFDRVTVTEYHNSISSYQGASLSKLTITHEWPQTGDSVISKEFQNYPSGIFASGIKALAESKSGYIHINANNTDPKINIIQNIFGVVESYRFRMSRYITDGSLACSWLSAESVQVLSLEQLDQIRYLATMIGVLVKSKKRRGIIATIQRLFKSH